MKSRRRLSNPVPWCVCALAMSLLPAGAIQESTYDLAALLSGMDQRADHYGRLSRQIWEIAEVGYQETRSVQVLKADLQAAGFTIQENIADIPTAFTATWGTGKPVIGILGEYDALPGLSQDALPERKALREGSPGHGCGHNLLGAAAAFAAVSVKRHLETHRLPGTIRFYGTPAEEGGGGKIYMIRSGAFQDLDVALAWHPADSNHASLASTLANISAKFRFHGKAAHAAAAPDQGRSALDAVMVMNHAVDLMREHVPESTRIHYIITKGGSAPNIVPDLAEAYYYARHPNMPILDRIWSRIIRCAEAGALATDTRMEMEIVNSVYNVLPNDTLAGLFDQNLRKLGGIRYSADEQAFAEKLRATLSSGAAPLGSQEQIQPIEQGHGTASTDLGDVSWIVPTAEFSAATYVPGTPGHSWQSTACAGTGIGRKGMILAAKTLATTALDLFTNARLVSAARSDFERRRAGFEYRSRIPPDQKPPLNYRN